MSMTDRGAPQTAHFTEKLRLLEMIFRWLGYVTVSM